MVIDEVLETILGTVKADIYYITSTRERTRFYDFVLLIYTFFYKQLFYPKQSYRVAYFLCQNHDKSCLAVATIFNSYHFFQITRDNYIFIQK